MCVFLFFIFINYHGKYIYKQTCVCFNIIEEVWIIDSLFFNKGFFFFFFFCNNGDVCVFYFLFLSIIMADIFTNKHVFVLIYFLFFKINKAIWKPSEEWFYFIGNVLVQVRHVFLFYYPLLCLYLNIGRRGILE